MKLLTILCTLYLVAKTCPHLVSVKEEPEDLNPSLPWFSQEWCNDQDVDFTRGKYHR